MADLTDEEFQKEITKLITDTFGEDPISTLHALATSMSKNELIGLLFVSINRLATTIKGGTYDDPVEAAVLMAHAAKIVYDAHINASMDISATSVLGVTGCA